VPWESPSRWAFGVHAWRHVTFPVAIGAFLFVALRSPIPSIRWLSWGFVIFYAVSFVLVLTGRLTLPRE